MLGRRRGSKGRVHAGGQPPIESLEQRTLLSAAPPVVMHSDAIFRPNVTVTTVQGFTPAQIRHAYGFDLITQNGAGQTIAISDAYNDPNIQSDLATFDAQFNLPAPPSFQVVNQTGSPTSLPTTDPGWAGEESLDVEWAHAIAPAANIILVEANAATTDDLMATVNYARSVPGVSVISMSWGGSEFFAFPGATNFQFQFDPDFTTPAGHQGITFVASSGDSGQAAGAQWPASAPNVLSVGGTSLTTSDQNGTYQSEQSWAGSSGGYSTVETEPAYQQTAQQSGTRTTPDVAYDGDPATGFAIYDSLPVFGVSGWQEVGGTSAGSPQWAALIALADQQRVSAGLGTLDGPTQTIPMLYSEYGAPGSAKYSSTYTQVFNDVIDPTGYTGGVWQWAWGTYGVGGAATAGYDTITGMGTPYVPNVMQALTAGAISTRPPITPPTITAPSTVPLEGVILNDQPTSVMTGQAGKLKLKVINTQGIAYNGPVSVQLYVSSDGTISPTATPFTTLSVPNLQLRPGRSKVLTLKFNYPSGTNAIGTYYIVSSVTPAGIGTSPAQAFTKAKVSIAPPNVDLGVSFATPVVDITPGKKTRARITIENFGNSKAIGTLVLSLYASSTTKVDATSQILTALPARRIHLRPGQSMTITVPFVAPSNRAAGTYNLVASISSSTSIKDVDQANDTAAIAAA